MSQRWISAIILTHGHYDHFGGVPELLERLPEVPVAMHAADRDYLGEGVFRVRLRPTSTGAALSFAGGMLYAVLLRLLGRLRWPDDITRRLVWLDSAPELLDLGGFEVRVIATPGHSPGSVSLQLPTGEMLTGDLISAGWPRTRPRWPMLVDREEQVLPSLRRIAGLQPATVHPGHGGPFAGSDVCAMVGDLDARTRDS